MPLDEVIEEQALAEDSGQTAEELPILTVRDTVLFPHAMLPITVGRPSSLALVQSLGENRMLGVVSQLDPRTEQPAPGDLYEVGTVAILHKAIQVPKESLLLFCEGVARIRTVEFTVTEPFPKAKVERMPEIEPEKTPEIEALRQNVWDSSSRWWRRLPTFPTTFRPWCSMSWSPAGWRISLPARCPARAIPNATPCS